MKNLVPGHSYIIQVMMKIDKEFISYQTLKVLKSHHCFVPILSEQNQLPNTMKSDHLQHNEIEDNRIFIP